MKEQGVASGAAQPEAAIFERDCLRSAANALHAEADKLPKTAPWRLWFAHFASGLERHGVDDPTANLLMGTANAAGRLMALAADLSHEEPDSTAAVEIQAIARELQEIRVLHPAAQLLLEARTMALAAANDLDSSNAGEMARERLRIQQIFEKYKSNPPASEEEKIEYEDAVTAEEALRYRAVVYIANGEGDDAVLVARAVLGGEALA